MCPLKPLHPSAFESLNKSLLFDFNSKLLVLVSQGRDAVEARSSPRPGGRTCIGTATVSVRLDTELDRDNLYTEGWGGLKTFNFSKNALRLASAACELETKDELLIVRMYATAFQKILWDKAALEHREMGWTDWLIANRCLIALACCMAAVPASESLLAFLPQRAVQLRIVRWTAEHICLDDGKIGRPWSDLVPGVGGAIAIDDIGDLIIPRVGG